MQPILLDSYGYLSIVANTIGNVTIKVFDSNGRIAKKMYEEIVSGVGKLDINFSDLSSGTYIVNAFCGDMFIKSMKFIK